MMLRFGGSRENLLTSLPRLVQVGQIEALREPLPFALSDPLAVERQERYMIAKRADIGCMGSAHRSPPSSDDRHRKLFSPSAGF